MQGKNRNRHFKKFHKEQPSQDLRTQGILPAPGILESYEEIAPGSVEKILQFVKQEQEHRHRVDSQYIKMLANTYRMGQLLAFLLAVIVLYVSVLLITEGHTAFAASVLVFGFVLDVIILLCYQSSAGERMVHKQEQYARKRNFKQR